MVNGFYAKAAIKTGNYEIFDKEFNNLTTLALDKGNGDFKEIYNASTGEPDGGWQSNFHWKSCNKQTWSATAYMDMVLNGIFGLRFSNAGQLTLEPHLPKDLTTINLNGIKYRNSTLNIQLKGSGNKIKSFTQNGKASSPSISAKSAGTIDIVIELTD